MSGQRVAAYGYMFGLRNPDKTNYPPPRPPKNLYIEEIPRKVDRADYTLPETGVDQFYVSVFVAWV